MANKPLDPNCYNCESPIANDEKYCGHCGQKHHDGKYSVGEVITEFISANFNLDAKIFQTIIGLFRPGFLTEQYFKGIHKKYYKPVRLFLVLGIIVFALLRPNVDPETNLLDNLERKETAKEYEAKWDSLKMILTAHTTDEDFIKALDTMYLNPELMIKRSTEIDSSSQGENGVFNFQIGENEISVDRTKDSVEIFGSKFSNKDFLEYQPKEFVDKFFPNREWYKKMAMSQFIKVIKDGGSLIDYIMGRITIFLLFLTPFYALVYWLLYIRHKRFFVEHFVFLLHLNSAALIFILISYLLMQIIESEIFPFLAVISYLIYYYLALKRYYKQGVFKTFIKLFVLNLASAFVGTLALILILLLGILLF